MTASATPTLLPTSDALPEAAGAVGRLLRSHRPGAQPLRVLSASGQLGYGIVEASLERGLARQPHFIGCDMGSIDPGPY